MADKDITGLLTVGEGLLVRGKNLFNRYFLFLLVAGLATVVHVAVMWGLVGFWGINPLIGNVGGFCAAALFNYIGQHKWTFSLQHGFSSSLATGLLINFLVNQSLYAVVLWVTGWHYLVCLLVVLAVVSPISFLIIYAQTRVTKKEKNNEVQ